MGPLINEAGRRGDDDGPRTRRRRRAATVLRGGDRLDRPGLLRRADDRPGPTRRCRSSAEETFAPILYAMTYRDLDEAIAIQNGGRAGALLGDLHRQPDRGRAVPLGRGVGLRDRQRQHRHLGRRDRRRLRRREGDRRRPRGRLRLLEGLHAAADLHHQRRARPAAGPGSPVRDRRRGEWNRQDALKEWPVARFRRRA